MAAQRVTGPKRRLQINRGTHREITERRQRESLSRDIRGEGVAEQLGYGQAHALHSDAVADPNAGGLAERRPLRAGQRRGSVEQQLARQRLWNQLAGERWARLDEQLVDLELAQPIEHRGQVKSARGAGHLFDASTAFSEGAALRRVLR